MYLQKNIHIIMILNTKLKPKLKSKTKKKNKTGKAKAIR
jgi:hypothetical protein